MQEAPLEEFSAIRRMKDARFPHEIATLMPGEYFVSQAPMIVHTLLGSCISACIRDPLAGVGGMNHFMLPQPRDDDYSSSWGKESLKYGIVAMELLINEILKRGGHENRLEVKIVGGGRIYEGGMDIGAINAAWTLEYLDRRGFTPITVDVGGINSRKVHYFTRSGRVLVNDEEQEGQEPGAPPARCIMPRRPAAAQRGG
nr:chemoreceptor glutamine deamidase CheD [Nitrospirota bacterium]